MKTGSTFRSAQSQLSSRFALVVLALLAVFSGFFSQARADVFSAGDKHAVDPTFATSPTNDSRRPVEGNAPGQARARDTLLAELASLRGLIQEDPTKARQLEDTFFSTEKLAELAVAQKVDLFAIREALKAVNTMINGWNQDLSHPPIPEIIPPHTNDFERAQAKILGEPLFPTSAGLGQ